MLGRREFLGLFGGWALLGAETELDRAFLRLYDFDFVAAHGLIDSYVATHGDDPLGYSSRASAHLFSEMDRLGILAADFFLDDDRIADKKKLKPDPRVRDAFYWATTQCRERAERQLGSNSADTNALLALSMTYGLLTDYAAFVEKRQLGSLTYAKQSQHYAVRLLAIDPGFADAYLTTGISEYLLGSMPFFVKWFVKFEQAKGSKEQAMKNLQIVAKGGRYFGPFARILLAVVALREKRRSDARMWLEGLVREFPRNALLRRELDKLSPKIR
ncbi:MAG: hypothetical protein ACKV2U_26190 [Bryobacteraceae bacterium]